MKELNELLATLAEAGGQNNIKTAAGIGAGVGAALGLKNDELIKSTILGAGVGAALAWAADELIESDKSASSLKTQNESGSHLQMGDR